MRRRPAVGRGETRRRNRSLVPGCLGVGCGLPVLTVLTLWLIFSINNRPPNIVVPTPPSLPNNGYNDFLRAAQMARGIKHKSPASMVNPPTDDAGLLKASADCAKDAAPALAVMRQGLSKPCQGPVERSFGAMATIFPQYASIRELVRTLYGTALYYELSGQPGKAVETMLDGAEMAVMLPHGGGLISDLHAAACESIALRHFETVLPRLSSTELAHVADRLDRIAAKRVPYAEVLLEVGNSTTAGWQAILRDPKTQGVKANYEMIRTMMEAESGKSPKWQENWQIVRISLASKAAMVRENQNYFKALAEETHKPFTGKSRVPVPTNFMSSSAVSYGGTARAKHIAKEAILDLYRIETALYRYKAAAGRFPNTLSQLVPSYLPAVPMDPFTGTAQQPYHYEAQDGGKSFSLYGLGTDMANNAGYPTRYPGADEMGDMVAGHLGRSRKKPQ